MAFSLANAEPVQSVPRFSLENAEPVGPALPSLSDSDFSEFQKAGFNGTKEELQKQMAAEQVPHDKSVTTRVGSAIGNMPGRLWEAAKQYGSEIIHHPGDALTAPGEAAEEIVTNIASAIPALFSSNPEKTRKDFNDAPRGAQERTPATEAINNALGAVTAPIGEISGGISRGVSSVTGIDPSRVQAGIDVATMLTPAAMESAAAKAEATAANAIRVAKTPTEVARAANYKLRPSDIAKVEPDASVGGGKRIEKFSGSGELRKDFIEPNQATTTSIAVNDIGLPEGTKSITPELIDNAVKPHVAVYKEVGNAAGTFKPSTDLSVDFDAIANRRGLEPDIRDQISKQVDKYRTDVMEGADTVKTISVLRRRASKQMQSDDVGIQDRGVANRSIADAMESELERQLSTKQPGLIPEFQHARTQLAKINNVYAATRAGQVDAHVLRDLQSKGVPLSGGLKIIADTAEHFPWVTKHPLTYADIKGAKSLGGENFYNAMKAPMSAAGRKILGSDAYQNALGPSVDDIRNSPKLSKYFDRENALAELRRAAAQPVQPVEQRPMLQLPAPSIMSAADGNPQLRPGTDFARREMGLHEVGNARQPPLSALSDTLQSTIQRAQAASRPQPFETVPYSETRVINPESFMPGLSPRARLEAGRTRTGDLTTDEAGGIPFNPPEDVPPVPPRAEPLPRPPPGRFARLAPGEDSPIGGAAATITPGSKPGYYKINVPGETSTVEVQGRGAAEDLIKNLHEPLPTSALAPAAQKPMTGSGTLPHKPWDELLSDISKRNATPELKHSVSDTGEHVIESPVGAMIAQEAGGQLKIKYAQVKPEARGNKYGQAMLKRMVQEGEAKGLQPVSDFSVSPEQQRVYAALKRDGYSVKQNPAAIDKETGNLISEDPSLPVYEISSPKAASATTDIDAQLKAMDADAAKKKLFYSKSPSERLKKLEDAHLKERRRLLALKKAAE